MKTLLIASMIALAGTAAFIAPTQAASLIIQSDDGDQYSSDNDQIRIRRHHDRQRIYDDNEYSDNQGNDGQWRRHHRHHRCHIELVKHWRHHHRVIEQVRVCG